ncbi:MAG TPA: hypothetical protein PKW73_12890 [Candidatus Obscuribacter sp.]|nr:hypothetical protein [Candidatus Obscuribacter sp.]
MTDLPHGSETLITGIDLIAFHPLSKDARGTAGKPPVFVNTVFRSGLHRLYEQILLCPASGYPGKYKKFLHFIH